MKAKMGLRRKYGNHFYGLVAVADKKTITEYAKKRRSYGYLVRITNDKWDDAKHSNEYTAWEANSSLRGRKH
jgi:hypothetical protein